MGNVCELEGVLEDDLDVFPHFSTFSWPQRHYLLTIAAKYSVLVRRAGCIGFVRPDAFSLPNKPR